MLDIISTRNPGLVKAAVELHQQGAIPANSYVVDLDAVRENARAIKKCVDQFDLRCFVMTKQFNRNPSIISTVIEEGLDKFVAVDYECASLLHRQGARVAHVGHLVQIPKSRVPEVLGMDPEVWTVFSLDNARFISDAAVHSGVTQDLLMKVVGPKDEAYTAQEGGIPFDHALGVAKKIQQLPNVRIVGVTGFFCTTYDFASSQMLPTANLQTICEAAEMLRNELGMEITYVNAPGSSSCQSMELIAAHGATDTEPGSALWGMCPQQLFGNDVGTPAVVYLSEVSHFAGNTAQVIGGGFFPDVAFEQMQVKRAFVGPSPERIFDDPVRAEIPNQDWIDYYGWLYPQAERKVEIGDSVVYFFRPQIFKTRSASVATITGIGSNSPSVCAVHDRDGNETV